ncbi:MAG TPA: NAD(P)H-hydrate dehydratase [Spirochaetales bacterium]|nr:NAD(P)H-hydrate dehydratase [Spirochaetales bacterium]
MERLIRNEEAQRLDAITKATLGIDDLILMEKASIRLWDALKTVMQRLVKAKKGLLSIEDLHIVAICGKGNNGGDTLAVLRHAWSFGFHNIDAFVSKGPLSPACTKQRDIVLQTGVRIHDWGDRQKPLPQHTGITGMLECGKAAQSADIILDGVLGSGIKGEPREEAASMIVNINELRKLAQRPAIISIDLPSGLWGGYKKGDLCVHADITLALSPTKIEYFIPDAREACGSIVRINDVFPKDLIEKTLIEADAPLVRLVRLEASDLAKLNPSTSRSAYKISRGRLAILAGSKGRLGAAIECARAALVSGAGYVTLFVEDDLYNVTATALPSVIVRPEGDFFSEASKSGLVPYDTILAGPGWGLSQGRKAQLESILRTKVPLVLDADALRLIYGMEKLACERKYPLVLTPHPGEYKALCGEDGQTGAFDTFWTGVSRVASRYNAQVVYKSHVTWITSPNGRIAVWDGRNPALGTAGSGDVLSGLLAGLLAAYEAKHHENRDSNGLTQNDIAFEASCAAVVAHGVAGTNLARRLGWFAASELVPECGKILGRADNADNADSADNRRRNG